MECYSCPGIAYTQKEKESILRLANKFINSLGHKIPY